MDEQFSDDPRIGQILDIVAKETRLPREKLRPGASLTELGVESIDLTMAVFAIESAFNVDIPVVTDKPGAEFTTVGDLVGHVIDVLDKEAAAGGAKGNASQGGAGGESGQAGAAGDAGAGGAPDGRAAPPE